MDDPSQTADLSREQQDTTALVRRLLGKRIADRYVDFCRLAAGGLPLRVSAPLAAHALRELESILRQTLDVPMDVAIQPTEEELKKLEAAKTALRTLGYGDDLVLRASGQLRPRLSHKEEIEKIVTRLDLAPDGDIARAWKSISQAHGQAHGGRALHHSTTVDDAFRAAWQAPFDVVLRGLMIALQGKYAAFMHRIDQLVAMPNRSAAVTSFSKEIPGALPLLWHFFNELETPDWLPQLMQRNLLTGPEEDETSGNSLRLRQWPASRYLLRMAKTADDAGRAQVAEALKRVARSTHPDVQLAGMEILAALPAAEAASLVDVAEGWLTPKARFIMAQSPYDLIRNLATDGQGDAALRIARALFQVFSENGRLATLFSRHMYEHFLPETVRAIAPVCKLEAVHLLAWLLDQALRASGKVSNEPPHDYSYYLSGGVTEHGVKHDVIDALVGELTRAAKLVTEIEPSNTANVVACIKGYGWKLFIRIALHVLSFGPGSAPETAQALLADKELIDATWARLEYGELARSWFPSLSPKIQSDILAFVDAVPERFREPMNKRFEEVEKRPPTAEEQNARDASIVRDIIWHWRDVVPEERRLAAEKLGDPDAWRRKFDEPDVSPLTAPDFSSRPIEEIVAFLQTWRPTAEEKRETTTALAQQLREAVNADPLRYSTDAATFASLAPIYVRRLLEGLSLASNNGNSIAWAGVLNLVEAITYSDSRSGANGMEGDDPDWSWARKAAIDVLTSGLGRGNEGIAAADASRVQSLILALHRSAPRKPDSDDFEESYRQFPHHGARSTSRGAAVQLLMYFLFWMSKVDEAAIGKPPRGMIEKLPAVRRVLEAELADMSADGRIPRAILGRFLQWLFFFDEDWLKRHLETLFPEKSRTLSDAAWHAHLSTDNGPVSVLACAMQRCYETEIDALNDPGYARDQRHVDDRLAEYLVILYIGDALPDALFERFWNTAPSRALQHAMWFLGEQLELPPKNLPEPLRARAVSYWERRLAAAEASSTPDSFRDEIGALGQFFFRKGISDEWLIGQIAAAAEAGFAPSDPYSVLDRLAKASPKLPDCAARALAALIKCKHADAWTYMTQGASMRAIFVNGLAVNAPEITNLIIQAINYLASIGDTGYLDLLPKRS
ncbi:hypothetical protein [Bradyrhizobium sp. 169]|uniref:hypothetical protein n=1 Tax=Bradyrhizobium sp. 169 TaxID=2782640 RepID=UPI001FF7358D|nr:hypothetical protein [Bradyrhizobium sp. 169]MCK1590250.1 hypothetical protein [Bradyrhizobium sp. 169]